MKDEIKLVAAFMGIPIRSYYGGVFYISDEDGNVDFDNNPEVYRPSKNWNQLMPVVEKIENTKVVEINEFGEESQPVEFSVEIRERGARIYRSWITSKKSDFGWNQTGSKINSTYKAVIEFIKWYRSQPEGNTVNMK